MCGGETLFTIADVCTHHLLQDEQHAAADYLSSRTVFDDKGKPSEPMEDDTKGAHLSVESTLVCPINSLSLPEPLIATLGGRHSANRGCSFDDVLPSLGAMLKLE